MSLKDVPGQVRAKRFLKRLIQTGNHPHSLLFSGMPGIGKAAVAREFAKLLNCLDPQDTDCCDKCSSCRKFNSGHHPDLLWVKSEGVFIKIDQIRQLRERLRYRPFEGKYRVVVIQDAQDLKEDSSNALLKILEEPPKQNVFMLLVLEPQMLLETIVSRCCHIRFQPLDDDWIEQHLIDAFGIPAAKALEAVRLAEGSVERARTLAEGAFLDQCKEMLGKVCRLKELSMIEFFSFINQWVHQGEDLERDLEYIKLWIRDLVFSRLMVDYRPTIAVDEGLRSLAARASVDTLFQLYDHVERSIRNLRQNANKQLTMEGVCLTIREGF
ncbi:MAG: DNA polymerase III subunit delta' [Syntrophobacteraceae bacterium]